MGRVKRHLTARRSRITALHSRIQELERAIEAMRNTSRLPPPEDLILASVQDAVIVVNREHQIQFWNRAAEMIYGWSATEVHGQSVQALLQTHYAGLTSEQVAASFEQEGGWIGLVVQRHRDGHDLMIESAVRVLYDTTGALIGRVGVNRDVTARVREETARHVNEATSALLATTRDEQAMLSEFAHLTVPAFGDWCAIHLLMPDGEIQPVVIYHTNPNRVAAIEPFTREYGFHREVAFGIAQVLRTGRAELIPEITPARLAAVLHDTTQQQLLLSLGLCSAICVPLKTRTSVFGVVTFVAAESRRRYQAADLQIACDMAERAAAAIAHMRLSHDVQAAGERSDATLALLEALLTSATIGIAFFDRTFRYTHINEALAAILGRPAADYPGQTIDAVLPDLATRLGARLRSVLETNAPITDSEITIAPGTAVRPGSYVLNYYPVRSTTQEITGVGVIVLDITEGKRLRDQLAQSQKLEGLGRLAGGIAHDFNNLMTAILGNAELASETLSADAPEQEDLQQIAATATRAATLTRQLLTFAHTRPLEPIVLDLNDLLQNVAALLRRLLGEDIALITQLAPDVWSVQADAGQIEQVIVNLAVNARDAMEAGGQLTIETANVELDTEYAHTHVNVTPGAYVRITVSDTGEGISPEVQTHIFEPFFTTKQIGKGTGLGLATSYSIVQQHGGAIWVYSEVGQGTTFTIYLPRVYSSAEERDSEETEVALPQGNETVLLVEDEEAVRILTARVLRTQGFRVLEAIDGPQALARIASDPGRLDVVLTDMVMPSMNGAELVARLRRSFPQVRVLYMSGYTEHALVQRGEIEPTVALLHKPFTRRSLLQKLRSVLDWQTPPTAEL